MDSVSKSQHIKLYLKLKQQECNIQKSVALFIDSSKGDSEQWHGIKRDMDKNETERQKVLEPLHKTVNDVYKELRSIKDMISKDKIERIDLESFKRRLQGLWKKIQDFKDSLNDPGALIEEQKTLEADIGTMMKKILKYKDFISNENSSYKNSNSVSRMQIDGRNKECDYDGVEDFCILVAKTGHTGGWSEEEHQLFLRARRKLRGFSVARLALAVHSKLPQLSPESIVNHEAWYRAYLQLRQRQRIALNEWRASKTSTTKTSSTASAELSTSENPQLNQDERSPGTTTNSNQVDQEAALEAKKRALEEWKLKRQEQRRAEQSRVAERVKTSQVRAEARRRARAARIKRQLAQRRADEAQRKEAKTIEVSNGDTGTSVTETNRVAVVTKPQQPDRMSALILQIYRARDRQFIERKKKVMASKFSCSKLNTQPTRNISSKSRESTLFKETRAWKERVKSLRIAETKSIQPVNYIKDLPKRTIATWKSFEIS
ncbi:hypothetical protein QAD02_014680 [Eretmocerus hayati]|uniref:Uncharacterized protein n=1 Tax=Eretmocerus hayati TaxID=131215 RepID=A0ACC2P5Y2_9HYME|nr:hypothetical protein QAD02_014680 [Eretmocerus hayati]